ncbi:MAG: DUF3429 domain-containing protein [Pseudomonadota bacterium]
MDVSREDRSAQIARRLGYAGLIPFVGLGVAAVLELSLPIASVTALLFYAATILSFLGALQWGLAIAAPHRTHAATLFVASVIPSLIAWSALLVSIRATRVGLAMMAAGFVGWYLWERVSSWSDYPGWFQRLRGTLTTIVSITLAVVAITTH